MRTAACIFLIALVSACSHRLPEAADLSVRPTIFPDYAGVVIPPNIAPLNFRLCDTVKEAYACFQTENITEIIKSGDGEFNISNKIWKKLTQNKMSIFITIYKKSIENRWEKFQPFEITVAREPVDSWLAYRLIEPGYEFWSIMGIYQRNLENFTQKPLLENKMTDHNCMNCHSYCNRSPEKMLFHQRSVYGATYLIDGDRIEKLNTKTDSTISNLVYPSWHPSGRFVAFSVNSTAQDFHTVDRNRIEVYDAASDVVVYDVERHELITSPTLFSKERFETFPTFSPDGRRLYFCTARAVDNMPKACRDVHYSLCSVEFDPDSRTFGSVVDTLFNAENGEASVSFPRVSPDGRFLIFTRSAYGNFSIWHHEADLYIADLASGQISPLTDANSFDTESYHSWSSNSRWLVFSSRRTDGLYTQPFIAYIDESGQAAKPFLLPQKDSRFYDRLMVSFNVPEFATGPVGVSSSKIARVAKNEKGINVAFGGRK